MSSINTYFLLFFFILFTFCGIELNAQDITTNAACFDTDTWSLDATDGTGRNVYINDQEGNIYIRWHISNNRWEMNTEDAGFAYWHNSFASTPNPPDFDTGSWTYVSCAATQIFGTGTQSTLTLPIELINFSAKLTQNHILLQWQTAVEINNNYMAIERSIDGKHFQEIGRVDGAGTTSEVQNYTFTDRSPLFGNNYYRLRQVDYDGATEFHNVISIEYRSENTSIQLAPNPASDRLSIQLAQADDQALNIVLYNLYGQAMYKNTIAAGQTQYDIDLSYLNTGQYILEVYKDTKPLLQERIIRN
ncbi:MAG: T9SS type A sorting domain-containing protein [Chitinophagales bacterium]|nr:T9SS type A sorting domain-containing protein [Chitinophagales bacterium]